MIKLKTKFYNNKLKTKKYFKILKYSKKFDKKFILKNFGLFLGDKTTFRFFSIFEIIKRIKLIKGDIVEFGVWNGNNLLVIKKISEYLNINKDIIGYDHFQGMPFSTDGNYFSGDKKVLEYFIKFFKFKKVKLIDDDFNNIHRYKKKIKKISFAYVDCDLYEETLKILNFIDHKITKGGIIAFDEALRNTKKGEAKALKEFYQTRKKKYKLIKRLKFYQPDILLIRN